MLWLNNIQRYFMVKFDRHARAEPHFKGRELEGQDQAKMFIFLNLGKKKN